MLARFSKKARYEVAGKLVARCIVGRMNSLLPVCCCQASRQLNMLAWRRWVLNSLSSLCNYANAA